MEKSWLSPAATQRLEIAARPLSRVKVSRILRWAGMDRLRSLDPPLPVVRFEPKRPDDMIHFDIKRLARIIVPGHRIQGDRTRETRGAGYEYLPLAIVLSLLRAQP